MRAHRLIRPAAGTGDIPAMTSLIEELGTPAFPASLFRAASAWVMPEHMAAFVFDSDMKPRTILLKTRGPQRCRRTSPYGTVANTTYTTWPTANCARRDIRKLDPENERVRGDPFGIPTSLLHRSETGRSH